MDLGVDDAGPHAVDAYALVGHFERQTVREVVDRGLAGGVVHIDAGRAALRGARRDVDDHTPGAAVPCAHAQHRLTRAAEAAEHVDCKNTRHARGAHLVDPRRNVADAGVVDQTTQTTGAKVRIDRSEQRHHLGVVGHVGAEGCGLAAGTVDFAHQRFGGGRCVRVVDGHGPAARCGQSGGRGTDAAAAAGDQEQWLHLAVGITNSAPLGVLSGQRCITDFCRV